MFLGSLIIGIVLLLAFLHYVGYDQVLQTLKRANPRIILVALGLDLLGLLLYGAGWYSLMRGVGLNIRFLTAQSIAMTGIFTCYVTPSGFFMDASRVLLASRQEDITVGQSAATVIMHKVTFTLGFVTFALVGSVMLIWESGFASSLIQNVLIIIGLIVLGVAAVMAAIQRPERLEKLAERPLKSLSCMIGRMIGKNNDEIVKELDAVFSDFRSVFLKMLRNPKTLLISYALMLLYWTTSITILYLVFMALNYPVPISAVMLTISVGDFVQMTPIAIPGMIGVLEVAFTSALVTLGVPLGIAASATILARIATFWFDLPITGIAASYVGTKTILETAFTLGKTGQS